MCLYSRQGMDFGSDIGPIAFIVYKQPFVFRRLEARESTMILPLEHLRQPRLLKRFQVHAEKTNFINHINASIRIVKFDTIEQDGIFIQKNIAAMEIAMNIPIKPHRYPFAYAAGVLL